MLAPGQDLGTQGRSEGPGVCARLPASSVAAQPPRACLCAMGAVGGMGGVTGSPSPAPSEQALWLQRRPCPPGSHGGWGRGGRAGAPRCAVKAI